MFAATAAVLFVMWTSTAAAAPPPPPVPVGPERTIPAYEPGGAPAPAPTPPPAAPVAPAATARPAVTLEPPPQRESTEEEARAGVEVIAAASFGDCTGDTCRNHESGMGFGFGGEVLYRLESGLAFGVGYWAQGVASNPEQNGNSWDPCQPLADEEGAAGCDAPWVESILRYRTYGLVGRYHFVDDGPIDPFVGLSLLRAWFQLWGSFGGDAAAEEFSYALTGWAFALEGGADLIVVERLAIGGLLRWTAVAWDSACLDGDLGKAAAEGLGYTAGSNAAVCSETSPKDFDATGLTDDGAPSAIQFMLRARLTL